MLINLYTPKQNAQGKNMFETTLDQLKAAARKADESDHYDCALIYSASIKVIDKKVTQVAMQLTYEREDKRSAVQFSYQLTPTETVMHERGITFAADCKNDIERVLLAVANDDNENGDSLTDEMISELQRGDEVIINLWFEMHEKYFDL